MVQNRYIAWLREEYSNLRDTQPHIHAVYKESPPEWSKRSAALDLALGDAVGQVVVWETGECERACGTVSQSVEMAARQLSSRTELASLVQETVQFVVGGGNDGVPPV